MEATTPELGPVGLWSPKSSNRQWYKRLHCSRRNFLSRRPSINKSEISEFLDQNHPTVTFYIPKCCILRGNPFQLNIAQLHEINHKTGEKRKEIYLQVDLHTGPES